MTNLEEIISEMIADEVRYFEEDGMKVTITADEFVTLKDELLQELCDGLNQQRDFVNDFVRAHAQTEEQQQEAKQ